VRRSYTRRLSRAYCSGVSLASARLDRTSVLQSLGSVASKRTYAFAINDFVAWYCSEPRLAFGRTVVLRYRY
jgi:hypothetical protein